jgi:uncharacterized membrane protein
VTFASFPPLWLAGLIGLAVVIAVWGQYRRPLAPLTALQRLTLVSIRATTLVTLVLVLFRPIALLPPAGPRDALVPVLVDVSRSMRLTDAEGQSRLARASSLIQFELLPALSKSYRTQLFAVGDTIAVTSADSLSARARQSDLAGALARVRERLRGERVAGIVLVSDGADTGGPAGTPHQELATGLPPVFAVGVGAAAGIKDREVLSVAAGDQRLDRSSIDLQVSTTAAGYGREPFELRLLAGGRLLERRRVTPSADGSPNDERFAVFPDPQTATVYTIEIPAERDEAASENNIRRVLVSPAGRKRRVLVIEGAPGFEHSFMTRAWSADSALEVDAVVRKGKNANGSNTFSIQAAAGRTQALADGFPARREDLYAYDALVLANIEGDFFTHVQLAMVADFVSERGGGLLVTGNRSFAQRGLIGTPVEAVLPVELDERRGSGLAKASLTIAPGAANQLVLTHDGEAHPIMRLGRSGDETRQKWAALPPLASLASLGPPRAGATVLAVSSAPGGGSHPVIAVQRYGRGRSMVFGGEASWRWRMLMASTDRSHEMFWRQASRWLTETSPDPVNVATPEAVEPGDSAEIDVDARDASFTPVAGASVTATIVSPDGREHPLAVRRVGDSVGRFTGAFVPDQPGAYHVKAEAMRGEQSLGTSDRWMLVGAGDREFADPRLNEAWLRRVARATRGRYVRANDAGRIAVWLRETAGQRAEPERRDLWNQPWAIAFIILLLSAEWLLRRRWGLR